MERCKCLFLMFKNFLCQKLFQYRIQDTLNTESRYYYLGGTENLP